MQFLVALFHAKHLLQAGAALLSSVIAEHRPVLCPPGRDKYGKVTG